MDSTLVLLAVPDSALVISWPMVVGLGLSTLCSKGSRGSSNAL